MVAGAAAAYIAFKATLAALNLFTTLMVAFGAISKYATAGTLRGAAFARGLGLGLAIGLPAALLGIADTISQALLPKNMPAQMESAFGFTGSIAARFGKWWAHLKSLASAGWSFLKKLFAGKGSGGTMGFIQAPSFKGLPKIISSVQSTMSSAVRAVTSKAGAFISAGGDLVRGLASGIRASANLAIQAAKDLASSLPAFVKKVLGIDSPSKVFAAIGRNAGQGLVVGLMASLPGVKKAAVKVADAASFGVGDELAVAIAARNRAQAKTKKGKASTGGLLRAAEGRQRVGEAKGAIKTFLAGISEKIQAAQLAKIMAPVGLARAGRAGREAGVARGGLDSAISRAEAEKADPRVQAKFARETLRLDARIAQARKSGSLEAIDALQGEKDALDARYGPQYLAELRDQLDQLNENEIEASSEAEAAKFAARFSAGIEAAKKNLFDFKGGSVQAFFAAIGKALTGSGVTPGQLTDISGGVPAAALTIPKKKPTRKRASGGYLTPGALTLVGETGPELIMGGKVMSSTRTNQMGGQGMSITVNAVGAAADDPMLLARQLGWQLATR